MNFIKDILAIIYYGLGKLSPTAIALTFFLALIFSVGCYLLCTNYSRLWNKSFQKTATHNVLSIMAAVLTFFFVLAFVSFTFFKEVSQLMILKWQATINLDAKWQDATFKKAYQAVKSCCENTEPFQLAEFRNGSLVPLNTTQAKEVFARVYADNGSKHFENTHPFLSKIIWSSPQIAQASLEEDIRSYFTGGNEPYNASRAIELVATKIKGELTKQTPRVVTLSRVVLIILFLIAQAIPFGLIGIAAYNSLKVRV